MAEKEAEKAPFAYTDKDLWGRDGRPSADDVQQKSLSDCYLVAAAGVVANESPDVIRSAIHFDERSGEFSVRLHRDGKWSEVRVTQAEIDDNILNRGGSSYRSERETAGGGLWPAIIEVAYAKQKWGSWAEGVEQLKKGGDPSEALETITGQPTVRIDAAAVGEDGVLATAMKLQTALAAGKRVVLGTRVDPTQQCDTMIQTLGCIGDLVARPGVSKDGVLGYHAYMVTGVRIDEQGEVHLKLRNTWGHNNADAMGDGERTRAAEIEVNLKDLIRFDTRSFDSFHIGQLSPTQQEMVAALRGHLGERVGEDAVAQAAVAASRSGITSARELAGAGVTEDGRVWVAGTTPGVRALVDTNGSLPPARDAYATLAREAAVPETIAPDASVRVAQRA